MGVRIYDDGHKNAGKAPCDRKYVTAGKSVEFSWNPVDGNTDISELRSLLGREVDVMVPVDTHDIMKKGIIVKLYPYHAQVAYEVGKKDCKKHELFTSLNVSDLVSMGLISFAKGKPEVIR